MLGAVLIVFAYFLLQVGRIDSRSLLFSVTNGLGASGIIFSLYFDFNLSAFAIELFWLVISFYGVLRGFGRKKFQLVTLKICGSFQTNIR